LPGTIQVVEPAPVEGSQVGSNKYDCVGTRGQNARPDRWAPVFADHAFGYLEGVANLVVAQACLQVQVQVQAKGFSYLTHCDSVGWHGRFRKNGEPMSGSKNHLRISPQKIVHVRAETASTITLKSRPRSA
jgi:hypothetical protein